MEPVDQAAYPWRLAGDVEIVSTVFDAGSDDWVTVLRKGPRCADHHLGPSHHRPNRLVVMGIGDDPFRRTAFGSEPFERILAPPCNTPAQALNAVLGQTKLPPDAPVNPVAP